MTDRELLELAAKANGFQVRGWVGDRLVFFNPITHSAEETWNPLNDDGDALRLAAGLLMSIEIYGDEDHFFEVDCGGGSESFYDKWEAPAAFRRAIVRAAAEIGRAMP